MALRESGKYGRVLMATAAPVAVSSELATLNATSTVIGGKTFAAFTVATLANKKVFPDDPDTPITVTFAQGTGSVIPDDVSFVVDFPAGRIFISPALTLNNTVTVSYSRAGAMTEMAVLNDWTVDETVKEVDVTSYNDEWEQFVATQKGWTATITGLLNLNFFDQAWGNTGDLTEQSRTIPSWIEFFKNKRTALSAANPKFAGMGFISFSTKAPYGGKVEFTAKVKGTGGLARFTA